VNAAIAQFKETLHQEAALGQVVDHQMGPNESKALRFLAVFINHPTLAAEEEKFLLRAAQTAIKRATFARLQRDLNALEKAHKKTPVQASVLLDKILEILGGLYGTDTMYFVPAFADHHSSVYETPGTYTIYHLALENDDCYKNYGIYANGLLVETCSIYVMKEFSNMNLIE
jgi:hypothetical protein